MASRGLVIAPAVLLPLALVLSAAGAGVEWYTTKSSTTTPSVFGSTVTYSYSYSYATLYARFETCVSASATSFTSATSSCSSSGATAYTEAIKGLEAAVSYGGPGVDIYKEYLNQLRGIMAASYIIWVACVLLLAAAITSCVASCGRTACSAIAGAVLGECGPLPSLGAHSRALARARVGRACRSHNRPLHSSFARGARMQAGSAPFCCSWGWPSARPTLPPT